MIKIIIKSLPLLLFITSISCKKESGNPAPVKFASDTTLVEVDYNLFSAYKTGSYDKLPRSIAYDSVNNSLYFYKPLNDNGYLTGFEILHYNIATKSLVSEYINNDPNWYNSNGSEGMRLFIFNNELWIPGGATNGKVVRLAIGDNSLSFLSSYDLENTDFGGKKGYTPYDIAESNAIMYFLSMNDYVFYASYSSLTTEIGNFATSATSHGSSIVSVNLANIPYIMVKCGDDSKIELYNTSGTYIRGVATNSNNSTQLIKDSRQRVYYYDLSAKKIIRYSADLLTKEEFPVLNFNSYYYGITLKEEKDRITLYCRYSDGLGKVSLIK
jgi:hypothetical protein